MAERSRSRPIQESAAPSPSTSPSPRTATSSPTPSSCCRAGTGQSILLIDDEESILALTSQALDSAGYRVRTAASGAAAIALVTSNDHDIQLVITDMSMPGLDGASTILAVREIQPDLTFLAVSGLDTDHIVARTSEVDIDVRHFLSKPYTAGDLLEAVEAALSDR